MVGDYFFRGIFGSLRFGKSDELSRDGSSLMHQLVETVLPVGARLSENDRSSFNPIRESGSVHSYTFSIALHIKLLDVCREAVKGLAVGEDST